MKLKPWKEVSIAHKRKKKVMWKVLNGDCTRVMKEFPTESVDMMLTSPPYDNMRTYKGNSGFDFMEFACEAFRILKDGGTLVWNIKDQVIAGSETLTSFRNTLDFECVGFKVRTLIYHKTSMPYPSKDFYTSNFEYVFVCSKGKPKCFNPIRDKWNKYAGQTVSIGGERQKDGSLKLRTPWEIAEYGIRGSIWTYSPGWMKSTRDKFAYQHPALMPEELARDLLVSFSNEWDLILDPFAGGGTTLKMARVLNRRCIGIEIAPEYCKIVQERIKSNLIRRPKTKGDEAVHSSI